MLPWALLLAALTMALHLASVHGGFMSDDQVFVENNPLLREGGRWLEAWRQPYPSSSSAQGALYRPLTLNSYLLDARIHGVQPLGFHLTNLLLHGVVTLLVALACGALGAPRLAAIAACAVFACHPVHTEVVCWISGRAEALAAIGCLVSLLLWARWRRTGNASWAAAAGLAYLLALAAKETALPLPLALAAADGCGAFSSRVKDREQTEGSTTHHWSRRWIPYAVFAAALVTFLGVRWLAVGRLTPAAALLAFAAAPPATRYYTGLAVIGRALGLLLWPHPLRFDYSDYKFLTLRAPQVWFGILVLMGSVVAMLRWRGRAPVAGAGLAWFLCFLLPVCHLFLPIGTVFAERFVYLPSVGVCVLVGHGFAHLSQRGRAAWAGALLVLALLGLATVRRSLDWSSSEALYEAELVRSPGSIKAKLMIIRLGQSRFLRSDDPAALQRGDELAIAVMRARRPDDHVYTNDAIEVAIAYADALLRRGDVEQSLAVCQRFDALLQRQRALPARLRPLLAFQCGKTHEARGELQQARARYAEALAIWPEWTEARRRLERLPER